MTEMIVVPNQDAGAEAVIVWMRRMADLYGFQSRVEGGVAIPVNLDMSARHDFSGAHDMVAVLSLMGVTVCGVRVPYEEFRLPEGVRKIEDERRQNSWRVCPDEGLVILDENIRGGRRIEVRGDVLVRGAMGSGTEIVAGGSVVVVGEARGRILAGRHVGAGKAVVMCLGGFYLEFGSLGDKHILGDVVQPTSCWGKPVMLSRPSKDVIDVTLVSQESAATILRGQ